MFERYKYILNIAVEAVFLNKFRSVLTGLGIIFGVAAVIAMMAIGKGAQKEILDQMKQVGVNNLIIMPKTTQANSKGSSGDSLSQQQSQESRDIQKFSPGLTLKDVQSIKEFIPFVKNVSPEVNYETDIYKGDKKASAKLTGVNPEFFSVFNLELEEGRMFNQEQIREGKSVCIIGHSIKSKFFSTEDPIGKEIKCGQIWLRVIGVLRQREMSQSVIEDFNISDYNKSIYTPVQTILLRFLDRSAVLMTPSYNSRGMGVYYGAGPVVSSSDQLDKIVVQVNESNQIGPVTEILKKMMKRRHGGVSDFEIKVPELQLKHQQRTRDIFNIVLAAIASISLIVGGIGIMNIMLASVMERIKEIGIRQAIGARKTDIILQFLTEAVLISITGGLIGIILGIALSKVIMGIANIVTIVSPLSIIVSFGVSATVGIAFGYMPAKRASKQDPVASLRYE